MHATMEGRKRKRGTAQPPDTKGLKRPHVEVDDGENDLAKHLRRVGFPPQVCQAFIDHKMKLDHLGHIDKETLVGMGISSAGTQIDLLKCFTQLMHSREDGKVFNDPIHGHIELHPVLIKIIDTPQFQRLKYIKQLGGGYYVFPGASHNRFEHSLGVAYLAGEFIESLCRRQPELHITPVDILCVKMAGLCHDLGHGPFSHMFDGEFIPQATGGTSKWKHEQGSVDMLEHLIYSNELWPVLRQYNITSEDVEFVKELIIGPPPLPAGDDSSSGWRYVGRPVEKSFLYEIVANKRTGIDVDKWDYFARDCHCLGIPNNFDWKRYMKFARVIKVDSMYQICCRDKEVTNLYEMFHTRASLHRRAYKHKTSNIIETMITEALLKANEHVFLPGKDNKPVKMSEAIHDPHAYTLLNDSIIFNILQSTKPELADSKEILHRVQKRQLYKCIGQTQPSTDLLSSEAITETILCEQIVNMCTPVHDRPSLSSDDVIVKVMTFDYGMKEKNPIDEMRFYTKQNPTRAMRVRKDQVSQMLPHTFIEKTMRVYCKKLDRNSLRMAKRCFVEWCNSQDPNSDVQLASSQQLNNTDNEIEVESFQFIPYGTPLGTPMKVPGEGSEDSEPAGARMDELGAGRVKRNLSQLFS